MNKKIYNLKNLVILVHLATLVSCSSPDIGTRLGSTNFYLVDNGRANSKYIVEKYSQKSRIVVKSAVIDYKIVDRNISIARQVVNSYSCREGTIATEILDKYQYWIIGDDKKLMGPFGYSNFLKHISMLDIGKKITLPSVRNLKQNFSLGVHKLTKCSDPKSI